MEHVSKAMSRVNLSQQDSQNKPQTFTDNHHAYLTRLWLALDSSFGRKFDDGGGIDSPKFNEWMEGTKGITPAQMKHGIEKSRVHTDRQGASWPPTLGEFRIMCDPSLDTSRVQTYSNRNFTQERIDADRKALDAPVNGREKTSTKAAQKCFESARDLGILD